MALQVVIRIAGNLSSADVMLCRRFGSHGLTFRWDSVFTVVH